MAILLCDDFCLLQFLLSHEYRNEGRNGDKDRTKRRTKNGTKNLRLSPTLNQWVDTLRNYRRAECYSTWTG